MKFFTNLMIIIQNIDNIENRRNSINYIIFSFINIAILSFILYIKIKGEKEEEKNNNFINDEIDLKYESKNIIKENHFRSLENNKIAIKSPINIENFSLIFINSIKTNYTSLAYFLDVKNGWPFNMTKEEYLLFKQKQIFISRITNLNYTGKIKCLFYEKNITKNNSINENNLNSSNNFLEIKDDIIDFKFNFIIYKDNITKKEYFVIQGNQLVNKTDYYLSRYFFKNITDLAFQTDEKNDLLLVNGTFFPPSIFKINNKTEYFSSIEMKFYLDNIPFIIKNNDTKYNLNISSFKNGNFTLYLISNNKYKIQIDAQLFLPNIMKYSNLYKEDIHFNLIIIFMSIINAMGVYCLMNNIKKELYLTSAISLQNFSVNMIIHYHLTFSFLKYFLKININSISKKMIYGSGAFSSLINFVFFDYRFYLKFWHIKVNSINACNYRKITLKFILYITVLFIAFIYTYTPKRTKIHIIMITLSMWTPQIIHNIIANNRYIIPLFYIITYTIDKLLYFYFFIIIQRRNISLSLIIGLSIYSLFSLVILYLQSFLGARFMLPYKFKKNEFDLYKSKDELLYKKNETKNEECNICLSSLFEIEKEDEEINNKNENNNQNGQNEQDDITNKDNIITSINKLDPDTDKNIIKDINNSNNNNKENIYVNKLIINNIKIKRNKKKWFILNILKKIGKIKIAFLIEILFKFYKAKPIFYKPYILLKCGHAFHSVCLENWFGVKKECPICRAPI